jgi:DNA-binding NarL/FixJ family response regulator
MNPRQILIIDDQENIVSILRRELEKKLSCKCASANNSRDAFAKLKENPIELVICDVRLGEENGFQILKQIKPQYPKVGLMMMTAYRSPAYRSMAEELGVVFFIEKPFAIAVLVKSIERYFAQRSAVEAAAEALRAKKPTEKPEQKTAALHFKLQDLIQLFCLNGRNMLIRVKRADHPQSGHVYIQKGRVLHADWGDLKGEEAVFKLLAIDQLELDLQEYDQPVEQTIQVGWEWLLLEAARMNDEAIEQAARDASPAPSDEPKDPKPLDPADPFADFWKSVDLGGKTRVAT